MCASTNRIAAHSVTSPGGSITGLFGPHGVGETTLMSTIGGHDQVAAKSVRLLGENPFEHAHAMASTNLWLPSSP